MKCLIIALLLTFSISARLYASGEVNNERGVEALNAGRYDEAIGFLSQAHLELPDNAVITNNLSVAFNNSALNYEKNGNFEKARSLMTEAYKLTPQSSNVKKNLAYLLSNEAFRRYKENSGEDVTGLLNESFEYDDSIVQPHIFLGQIYYDRDNYVEAKKQWEKALALQPTLPDLQKKLDKLNNELTDDYKLREQQQIHFKVRYEGAELWVASRDVLDILEDAYNQAGRKFVVFPNEPLTVIIYTQERFSSVSGVADWFAGVYDGKIRIRRGDVEGDKKRLRQILFHEYMHAFVHYMCGSNIPVWLNEGIAQCYENMPDGAQVSPADRMSIIDRYGNDVPRFDIIDSYFHSASVADVQFAYLFSKAFVSYLITKGWDYNIVNLLKELKNGSSIDDAFVKIYFRNVRQMCDDWLFDLKHNAQ